MRNALIFLMTVFNAAPKIPTNVLCAKTDTLSIALEFARNAIPTVLSASNGLSVPAVRPDGPFWKARMKDGVLPASTHVKLARILLPTVFPAQVDSSRSVEDADLPNMPLSL